MDTRSGKMGDYPDIAKEPDAKPVQISPKEYQALLGVLEERRPEELALMRFCEERGRLHAPATMAIKNAFRLGFKAGRESK